MGGRGSNFSGGSGTSGGNIQIDNTESLVSARERKQREVDEVLTVARDISNAYDDNVAVTDLQVATLGAADGNVMAYYDSQGNLAVNDKFFDAAKIQAAYDDAVANGFHPSRGNKTGLEATASHEYGHRLCDVAGQRAGYGAWAVDRVSNEVVTAAAKAAGYGERTAQFRKAVSGYGAKNNAEAVAEAFADVYCNGNNAKRESRAIVTALNNQFFNGKGY